MPLALLLTQRAAGQPRHARRHAAHGFSRTRRTFAVGLEVTPAAQNRSWHASTRQIQQQVEAAPSARRALAVYDPAAGRAALSRYERPII